MVEHEGAPMKFVASNRLRRKAHALIPGGCHTYAKGDDQYPENSPGFITHGKGCHVWDVDGNEFIEYGMGMRAVTLGHAYEPVVAAAIEELPKGSNFTRPSPIETEYAEALLALVPAGEQVKFAKDGSTVTSAALRLARAHTGREIVAICQDHPFFSHDDWFIANTPMPRGIPTFNQDLIVRFKYNDSTSLAKIFAENPDKIACVIMEPARTDEPEGEFLKEVAALCRTNGTLLVFDEMITGFRWHLASAQELYGVQPDLSTFGKAMGNGFSVSALVGRKEIMEVGGLEHDRERVYLLSSTHGAETHALAAALATLEVYSSQPVIETLHRQGEKLQAEVGTLTQELGLQDYFFLSGRACNLVYATRDRDKTPSQPFRTLFLQELIQHGVIAPSFVMSYSHSDQDIERTVAAIRAALSVYVRALEQGVDKYLHGKSVKPVYRPYN
jgi:glutamate-1-semialdehyde 2,1-aminomutase